MFRQSMRGLTMMELLVVIAILAMMMGLSGAAYMRLSRSYKEQGAGSDLDVIIRQVHNSAIHSNAPGFVEINDKEHRVTAWAYRTVGLFHFEEGSSLGRTHGAFHDGRLQGAETYREGRIGKCVRLRPDANVNLGGDPDYDFEDGGYLEAYIFPTSTTYGGDNYIFAKMGCYGLWIDARGYLKADVGGVGIRSKDYRIAPAHWTKVALAWDATSTRLLVDDALVAHGKGAKAEINEHPLLIGGVDGSSLIGLVDEVRLLALDKGRTLELPSTFKIEHTCAPWSAAYFSPDGTLDSRYHAGPVQISLVQESRVRTVTISTLGTTSRLEVEKREGGAEAASPSPSNATGNSNPGVTLTPSGDKQPSKPAGSGSKPEDDF